MGGTKKELVGSPGTLEIPMRGIIKRDYLGDLVKKKLEAAVKKRFITEKNHRVS